MHNIIHLNILLFEKQYDYLPIIKYTPIGIRKKKADRYLADVRATTHRPQVLYNRFK